MGATSRVKVAWLAPIRDPQHSPHSAIPRFTSSHPHCADPSFSSTLRTLSSIVCSRSVRVPSLILVEIRGTPIPCIASWHFLTAPKTSSHSPSMFVPYAWSFVFSPASASMRSHTATSRDTDTPIPIGTTHKSAMTFILRLSAIIPTGRAPRAMHYHGKIRRGGPVNILPPDFRHAWRVLSKERGLTLVVVLSLGIGIGANSAIFSVVDALLLRPLPYPQPERLANVWLHSPGIGIFRDWPSPGQYVDIQNENH